MSSPTSKFGILRTFQSWIQNVVTLNHSMLETTSDFCRIVA
ncbi:hypothetical protein MtrunA17_Chr4g0069181 [Medicago truncatula]|uniref:Uncharacterized protein n=1 Tax=Medicago truncatula TaxID=3880 RepID=A0A396IJE4_MEDTR|nr:hypothetical protein MtrunA17_Chr4g0069181 [Medicago truncatula]